MSDDSEVQYKNKKTNDIKKQILIEGDYSPVPNKLDYAEVDERSKRVWKCIFGQKSGFNPRYDQIVYQARVGRKSLRKYLDELVDNNMLEITKGKDNCNIYHLKHPSEWHRVRPEYNFGSTPVGTTGSTPVGTTGSTPVGTTNKIKNKTNKRTTTTKDYDTSDLHGKELSEAMKGMNQSDRDKLNQIIKESKASFEETGVKYNPIGLKLGLSDLIRFEGVSVSTIERTLNRAINYVAERKSMNPNTSIINYIERHRTPEKQDQAKSTHKSNYINRTQELRNMNEQMRKWSEEAEEKSNVIDITPITNQLSS
jgi:hypothetical protein